MEENQGNTQTGEPAVEKEPSNLQEGINPEEQPGETEVKENGQPEEANRFRAKLYKLNEDGGWNDLGTGYCSIQGNSERIVIISEENEETKLLDTEVACPPNYHRQRDTIITWLDEEQQCDFAISFQELEGAQKTWEALGCGDMMSDEESDDESLPLPKADNLDEIIEIIQIPDPERRKRYTSKIIKTDEKEVEYFSKLKDIFETHEDLECENTCQKIFMIFKEFLNFDDPNILEILMSNNYYLTVFGALEYNPEINNKNEETKHRNFLQKKAQKKSFIHFNSESITEKIDLSFRLNYLKDTALAIGLDDNSIQVVGNLISKTNSELVEAILSDGDCMGKIFKQIQEKDMDARKESLTFLLEIIALSKSCQMPGNSKLLDSFKKVEDFNLSVFIRNCIEYNNDLADLGDISKEDREESDKFIINCCDILQSLLLCAPSLGINSSEASRIIGATNSLVDICDTNKNKEEPKKLFMTLTDHMIKTQNEGLKLQIHELLKFILDNDQSLGSTFYEVSFPLFSEYLPEKYKEDDKEHNTLVDLTKSLIVDIINRNIMEDNYIVSSYLHKHEIFQKVNEMATSDSKIQAMCLLKFYKTLIAINFKPYVTEMIKLNLCDVVAEVYQKIENKKNLIASIAYDLFSLICKKEHYDLAKYLCDKFEVVHPYLKGAADKYKEKVDAAQKEGDNIFDGYEDSAADQKANQEAYMSSLSFREEEKEEQYKKFDFLSQNSSNEPEEDSLLIKPKVSPNNGSKIQIDSNIFKSISSPKSDGNSKGRTKSILDENYVHQPIEFEKSSPNLLQNSAPKIVFDISASINVGNPAREESKDRVMEDTKQEQPSLEKTLPSAPLLAPAPAPAPEPAQKRPSADVGEDPSKRAKTGEDTEEPIKKT
ncbi:unnamed protein product [Moneuplotes crassus]|uniref:Serine/threonine-protein phosphatase 4 regulatory subunit 3-like central domain-containing protein n=2 Tax=Euplotes crassus TaxID=5936 RepID=A0AAD1XS94_EUPCR|nr:unnamed protein product [Moneuplotes crassus]